MPDPYIDVAALKDSLAGFFEEQKKSLSRFGSTVNQTFEAYVFASAVGWYKHHGWKVKYVHPKDDRGRVRKTCHLKFNTNGAPNKYTYVECTKNGVTIQIRHQLRVATAHYHAASKHFANVCLDLAVIKDNDLSDYASRSQLPNDQLITFGEAKHMSAFAELVAGFIGMVHELTPAALTGGPHAPTGHPSPFLYVSGWLNGTALGLEETVKNRGFNIAIHTVTSRLNPSVPITVTPKKRKPKENAKSITKTRKK